MMLHTIVPIEEVLRGFEAYCEDKRERQIVDINGVTMQVNVSGPGRGTVDRLLSTDPSHYLRPECQPGYEVSWSL